MITAFSFPFIATGSHETTLLAAAEGCPFPAYAPDLKN